MTMPRGGHLCSAWRNRLCSLCMFVSMLILIYLAAGGRVVLATEEKGSETSGSQTSTTSQNTQTATAQTGSASKNDLSPTVVWQHGLSMPSEPPTLEKASEESKQLAPSSGSSRWFKRSSKPQTDSSSRQAAAGAPAQAPKAAKTEKPRTFVSGMAKSKTESPSPQPLNSNQSANPDKPHP